MNSNSAMGRRQGHRCSLILRWTAYFVVANFCSSCVMQKGSEPEDSQSLGPPLLDTEGATSTKDSGTCDDTGRATWYFDEDLDGYGTSSTTTSDCEQPSLQWVATGGDCDDANGDVHPGQTEDCRTDIDDDCDGSANTGSSTGRAPTGCSGFYADEDGDGSGTGDPVCLCYVEDAYSVANSGDCDDADASVYLSTEECRALSASDWMARLDGGSLLAYVPDSMVGGADLTGDGEADLVIGSATFDGGAGVLYVLSGPVSGQLDLDTESWMMIEGEEGGDSNGIGRTLAGPADMTDDGLADIVVSTWSGVYGIITILDGPFLSSDFDDGAWASWSTTLDEGLGYGLDVSCDASDCGDPRIVIGAPFSDRGGTNGGAIYVVEPTGGGDYDITESTGVLYGDGGGAAGDNVAFVGDVSGDGLDDLLANAPYAGIGGVAYLVEGPHVGESSLADAEATFIAETSGAQVGSILDGRCDFDGDGLDDMLVGAGWDSGETGAAYVILGSPSGEASVGDVAELAIYGSESIAWTGWSGAFLATDAGNARAVIGSPAVDFCGLEAGAITYVDGPLSGVYLIGSSGDTICGESERDLLGFRVNSVDDWDGDGTDDLLVGALGASPGGLMYAGSVFLMPGSQEP